MAGGMTSPFLSSKSQLIKMLLKSSVQNAWKNLDSAKYTVVGTLVGEEVPKLNFGSLGVLLDLLLTVAPYLRSMSVDQEMEDRGPLTWAPVRLLPEAAEVFLTDNTAGTGRASSSGEGWSTCGDCQAV